MSLENIESVFPKGEDRKKILNEAKKWAEGHVGNASKVNEEQGYRLLDSPLEIRGSQAKDENISFTKTFAPVTPDSDPTFKDYIQHSLIERKGKAIGVEFGGIGSNLFTGFDKGYFQKTFAVTLADHRSEDEKNIAKQKEDQKGIQHTVIEGDLLTPELYEKLLEQLQGEKVDLIIERMMAGLNAVPMEPYMFGKIISAWYAMLREKGIMFAELPHKFEPLVQAWVKVIENEYAGKIEVQANYVNHLTAVNAIGSAVRIVKLPGAPDKLPLLDPKTIETIGKDMSKEALYSHINDMHQAEQIEREVEEIFRRK